MKAAVVTFPGSNCDRDLSMAFACTAGADVVKVWHKETALPEGIDIGILFLGVPGGFSYGDYLRCGAIASRSPIGQAVADLRGQGAAMSWGSATASRCLPQTCGFCRAR